MQGSLKQRDEASKLKTKKCLRMFGVRGDGWCGACTLVNRMNSVTPVVGVPRYDQWFAVIQI